MALVPIFFFLHMAEVPAVIFLALWFVLQLVNGLGALSPSSAETVAWWAHVGGFAAGALLMRFLVLRRRAPSVYADRGGPWGPVD